MTKIYILLFLGLFLVLAKTATVEEFASRSRSFSASSYKIIVGENTNKNILFSPFSAEILLALAQTGAKDKTAEEIRETLNLSNSTFELSQTFQNVLQKLQTRERYIIRTANKAYITKSFPVKTEFKQIIKEAFQADLENVDFSNSVGAANTINRWVEEKTKNKIQNLIAPGGLDQDTVAVLVNALYLKAYWYDHFDKYLTKKVDFHKNNYNTIQVDAMHQYDNQDPNRYYEKRGVKFLELPFTGTEASMVFVLPNQRNGISSLERNIEEVLAPQAYTNEYVKIVLPKFRLETQIDLKRVLQKLGIRKAFSREADFSLLAGNKGQVYISDVVQKTFIDVNEEGVEAAAASYGKISLLSSPPTPNKSFIADRPFLFYIKVKEIILFLGRVVDPTQQ